ncbi:MAG: hypothetical protein H9W81_10155 [Enterococcus sp.]|nr:hypothetical protein [Enterococcus sp.]
MTVSLEEMATTAAAKVYDLMDGAYLCNDGGGEYLRMDIPELNDIDTGYIIAYVPTLEKGADAKWAVDNGTYTMSFAHPTFGSTTPAVEVERWIGECVQKVIGEAGA